MAGTAMRMVIAVVILSATVSAGLAHGREEPTLEYLVSRADCILIGEVHVERIPEISSHMTIVGNVKVDEMLKGEAAQPMRLPNKNLSAKGIFFFRNRTWVCAAPPFSLEDNMRPVHDLPEVKRLIKQEAKFSPKPIPIQETPEDVKQSPLISLRRTIYVLKLLKDGHSPLAITRKFKTDLDFLLFERLFADPYGRLLSEAAEELLEPILLAEEALLESPTKADFMNVLRAKYGRDISALTVLDNSTGRSWVAPLPARRVLLIPKSRFQLTRYHDRIPGWSLQVKWPDDSVEHMFPVVFDRASKRDGLIFGKLVRLKDIGDKAYQRLRKKARRAGGPNLEFLRRKMNGRLD